MDTYSILKGLGYKKQNPNYNNKTKKLGATPTVETYEPQYNIAGAISNVYTRGGGTSREINTGYTNEELADYGITPNLIDNNFQDQLANAQSNWSKAFNAIGQTLISEIGIGTLKSFSDIIDAVGQATGLSDKDYTNPVSQTLEEARESFDKFAPIYTGSESGIVNPDFGWVMSNIPSIASSLTLLYPTKAVMGGIKAVTKGLKLGQGTRKAVRALTFANKEKTFDELNKVQKALNSTSAIAGTNAALELGTSALIMRTMENYQEARQTYKSVYDDYLEYFNNLDDDEYNNWLSSHKDTVGNLLDKSKDAVAKYIAGKSADKTFAIDYSNTVFDAIQLWGLRNYAKNLGIIKKNTSRAANEAQAISIATAGKTTTEAAKITEELIDKTPKYLRYLKYGGKSLGKTALVESTEGIEEAVNYIAQEEGINYGKVLLENEIATPFNDRLKNYLKSPDLYDAAFWGTIGGIVFHEAGSIAEARKLYKKAKESKARRDLNNTTGESIASDDFIDYLEMADNQSAVSAIRKRNIILDNTVKKLKDIEDNKNIFADVKPGEAIPEFDGDVEYNKAIAKERVLNEFISDIGFEAINSGTYDLLTEYLKDANVKKVITDNKIVDENEIESFTDNVIRKLEDVKNIYSGQLEHVRNQATYINATGNNTVAPEYIQIIAKENAQHLLNIKDLENRLNVTRNIESGEKLDDETSANEEKFRQAIDANSLRRYYAELTARIEKIKKDKSLNSIQKQINIEDLESRRRIALADIVKKYGHGELLFALRLADRINPDTLEFDDNLATKTDVELMKEFDNMTNVSDIDKLLRHSGKTLQRFSKLNKTVDEIVQETNQIMDDYVKKYGVESLAKVNARLAELFQNETYLNYNISLERSKVKQTTEEIQTRLDQLHNQMNEARKNALIPATQLINTLYDKYNDNFDLVIDVIKDAYVNGINSARKLAKDTLKPEDVDGLMQAISIFNFSNEENALILKYISALIDRKKEEREIKVRKTSAEINPEVPAIETEEPSNEDNRKVKKYSVIVSKNNKVTIKNNPNGRIEARINEDGSEELMYSLLPTGELGKITSTDYFDSPDFDVLSNSFRVSENPIVKKEGNKQVIVRRGKIEQVSSPVEEIEEEQPTKSGTPEPSSDSNKTQTPDKEIITVEASINDILNDSNNADAIRVVMNGFEQHFDKFGKKFDVAAAKARVIAAYSDKLDSDILGKIFDYYAQEFINAGDLINEKIANNDDKLETAAVETAMASKFTDVSTGYYSALFTNSFDTFLNLYLNTLPTTIIQGKQAFNINDLFDLCNRVAKRDFNTEPDALFKVISGYLTSDVNKNKDKYILLGDTENPKQQKDETYTEDTIYRIEIKSSVNNPLDPGAVKNVKEGDTLKVAAQAKEIIFFDKNNAYVGKMPCPWKTSGNTMTALVRGFVMDLTLGENGNAESSIKNIFEQIYLSNDEGAAELRGLFNFDFSEPGLAEAFAKNPIIAGLFKQTIDNAEERDGKIYYRGPLFMYKRNGKETVDYEEIFAHLKNVWRYTMNPNSGSIEENRNIIKNSINNYFNTQYDSYKAALTLSSNPVKEVKVVKASIGELIRVVQSTEGNYDKLTPITSAISNGQAANLGTVDPYKPGHVHLGDGSDIELEGMSSGSTLLILNTPTGSGIRRTPVKAFGVRLSDTEINAPIINEIITALNVEIDRICDKFVDNSIPMNNRIDEINRFLTYVFDGTKDGNINMLQDHNGLCRVVTTNNPNNNNPSRATLTFTNPDGNKLTVVFNTLGKFNTFVSSVSVLGSAEINGVKTNIHQKLLEAGKSETSLLKASLKKMIRDHMAITMSSNGFKLSDGVRQTDDSNAYFKIQNVNGKPKFVVEIGSYRKEFNSYEDFLISNNLVRVNTKVENNSNFRFEGKDLVNNKVVRVDIPNLPSITLAARKRIEEERKNKENKIHVLPENSTTQFNEYISLLNDPSVRNKGIAIVKKIIPDYVFEENSEFEELINELFPSSIIYDENYNDIQEDNGEFKIIGNVAQVNSKGYGRYFRYRQPRTTAKGEKTYSRGTLPKGTVVIGDNMLNLLSGNMNGKREGLSKLVHERLHYIINNNKDFNADDIYSALEDIYITFFDKFEEYKERLNNGDTSVARALVGQEYIEAWIKQYSKKIYSNIKENNNKKLEEFLVETITNPSFMMFANEVELENINNKKESIFDKILNFVIKFIFNVGNNFKIKDKSLLRKELNVLAEVITGEYKSESNITNETSSPVEESNLEASDAVDEVKANETVDDAEDLEDIDELDDIPIDSSIFDESFKADENSYKVFDSLTDRSETYDDVTEISDNSQRDMVSISEVFSGLDAIDTLDLRNCLADGTISYICR